jgi:hypothetical protein
VLRTAGDTDFLTLFADRSSASRSAFTRFCAAAPVVAALTGVLRTSGETDLLTRFADLSSAS